ncbi:hypothetical protein [uncultured Rhodoferax sp.]|uniref:hypothetical protein n=1 Tax=uncultured Rhodoferax sp. TaxID=223188 RepID=UPI0025F4A979|nr:hypothetical protein [uncultured Rhodoferax sp.]
MLMTKNILTLRLLVVAGLAVASCIGSVHAQDAKSDQQKALRKRQCEFVGKVATERGQCVDKSQVDAMNTKDRAEGAPKKTPAEQQRELRQRQCAFTGRVANEKGMCVDKS